ncbi:hypothetical protein [Colwellia sp. Arc7-D]|uniref:hypothetical protein n=1 Tax=Colwellia sp. Arc7-D TaxID=2161872 RepID=UPI000D389416|nr:hypothetical protein [Colwellia sp. Arc7-D]AWB57959.1 hypothetical protein DBO93_10500 [Colwellia sp. Arc7-D]
MKSTIIFSLFTLSIFVGGFFTGSYIGIAAGATPAVNQIWAGAKEMQAAIILINENDVDKAKTLLCNSIKTRLVIMNMAKPAQTTIADRQLQELEESTYQRINKDKRALAEICI